MLTKAFWIKAAEASLLSAASAFTGSLTLTTVPTWKDVLAAAVAGGLAALYTLVKQFGVTQTLNQLKQSNPPITRP